MAAVPGLEEEDAKQPSRGREGLVGERARIGNRMRSALARKLLVALWKLVTTAEVPHGVVLRPAIQAAV